MTDDLTAALAELRRRDPLPVNPEIERLARRGYVATIYATAKPAEASDIDRLARMAAEDSS
jgi:hypothetical protein